MQPSLCAITYGEVAGPESCPSHEHLANPESDPFCDQRSLELRDCADYLEHELAQRKRGVYHFGHGNELDTRRSPKLKTRDQRGEGTSETVKFPDGNDINNCFSVDNPSITHPAPVGSLSSRRFLSSL